MKQAAHFQEDRPACDHDLLQEFLAFCQQADPDGLHEHIREKDLEDALIMYANMRPRRNPDTYLSGITAEIRLLAMLREWSKKQNNISLWQKKAGTEFAIGNALRLTFFQTRHNIEMTLKGTPRLITELDAAIKKDLIDGNQLILFFDATTDGNFANNDQKNRADKTFRQMATTAMKHCVQLEKAHVQFSATRNTGSQMREKMSDPKIVNIFLNAPWYAGICEIKRALMITLGKEPRKEPPTLRKKYEQFLANLEKFRGSGKHMMKKHGIA